MKMSVWSRLGIGVAMMATFCIVVMETVQDERYYQTYRWHFCGALIAVGTLLWAANLFRDRTGRQRLVDGTDEPEAQEPEEVERTFFLLDPGFWGPMLVVFGAVLVFLTPVEKPVIVAAAAEPNRHRPRAPTNAPAATPATPVAFPSLKLQGVVYRAEKPAAILNGRTAFLGDLVGGATLVEIGPDRVTLELDGQRQVLTLTNDARIRELGTPSEPPR